MRELKSYISEGFFNNVGANNRIKLAIDTIKDASMNDKIDSDSEIENRKFINSLTSILRDIETDIKKGKFVFEYIRNDETSKNSKIIITLEIDGSNDVKWLYGNKYGRYAIYFRADSIASNVANDLYCETTHPTRDSKFRHSIAKTIKVTKFKIS